MSPLFLIHFADDGAQYRGIENPKDLKPDEWRIPGPLALGNAIFQAFTPSLPIEEASSIGAVALAIRKSIIDTRKYEHVKRIVAVSEPIWRRQSLEGLEHKFWPDDGTFVINSMPKYAFYSYISGSDPVADGTYPESTSRSCTSDTAPSTRGSCCTAPSRATRASSKRRPSSCRMGRGTPTRAL